MGSGDEAHDAVDGHRPEAPVDSGDLAWETGTNRLVVQSRDAPPATRTGRRLVAWKRGADGRWRYRVEAIIPDPAG